MFKKLFLAAALSFLAATAFAQVNLQVFYDFGKDRKYVTTTFEMFKGDRFGDTFLFIDHYYADQSQRDAKLASAINGSYFEIERGINFWQETKLGGLSAMVEYDGSTWGAGVFCFGAKYFLHSKDYRNTFTLALLYDLHIGVGKANVPIKFSGVWAFNDLFGAKGLTFKGFIDIWGNNSEFASGAKAYWSLLTEPQLWYCVGQWFKCEHLNIGGEIELSANFAGHEGFMCNPCLGIKWEF